MLGKKVFSKHYWLSIKDVEQLLGWHRSKIRRWMKKGWLPFTLDANRYARFPRTEIEQFAQEQLGHANVSITLDTYSHAVPSLQREAAGKLDALLASG